MLSINEIKEYVNPIARKYPIDKVILFGSYARGNANESSDVDLAIDSAGKLYNRKIFALGGELLSVFPVRVDVYDILELNEQSPLYKSVQNEGVIIYETTR